MGGISNTCNKSSQHRRRFAMVVAFVVPDSCGWRTSVRCQMVGNNETRSAMFFIFLPRAGDGRSSRTVRCVDGA